MASTPTFVFSSPSEWRLAAGPVLAGAEPFQRASEEDLAPNVPSNPPPRSRSRSTTPRPAESMHTTSSHEKENEGPYGGRVWFGAPPKATVTESEASESSRILRGRTLRVNTLHQRMYHAQEPSVYYPLDGLSPTADLAQTVELIVDEDFLHPQSAPLTASPSKTRFMHSNTPNPRGLYLLSRLPSLPDSPQLWLALYFVLNLSLTLYNKSVLIHFPFPYTLTALHALCGTIGTAVLLRLESRATGARPVHYRPLTSSPVPNLNGKELIVLFLFSILYTLNIVVSNASLRLVTVPFHQVVRASTPFFTIVLAAAILGRRCSKRKLFSLIPVVVGVGFATYGDYYFTAFGFFLTLFGTLLAALKTTLTNVILAKPVQVGLPVTSELTHHPLADELHAHAYSAFPPTFFSSLATLISTSVFPRSPTAPGYSLKPLASPAPLGLSAQPPPLSPTSSRAIPKLTLSPLHLLYLLSPLAFIQTTLLAHFTGELARVRWHLFSSVGVGGAGAAGATGRVWLLLNGALAFFLNVVSFNANRRVGPLGMSVAANVKQVLTILCAVTIFDLTITLANGVGIALTLLGGALYAAVELREKEEKKSRVG